MQAAQPSLFNRPDTLLGVCEGIGQDFGFNPLWLRIALAATILWNPYVAIGTYFVLGLLVLASRLMFPNLRAPKPEARPVEPVAAEPVRQDAAVELAEAA